MSEQDTTKVLSNALREVFGEKTKAKLFIDVSRIPLICKNIEGIHDSLSEISSYIESDKKWKIDDANWKKEFDIWKTNTVSPLVQKESDNKLINIFVVRQLKYAVSVVGFLVSLGLLFNYVINPLFRIIR